MTQLINRRDNLQKINERIAEAAARSGRNADSVQLLAVSKRFDPQDILEVKAAGHEMFGESRAQELRDKATAISDKITWHFIGPLQKNKIKYVVPNASLIHTIDSIRLAEAVAAYAERQEVVPQILIEINTSREENKHGFAPEEAVEASLQINNMQSLKVAGLMTMAPHTDDLKSVRNAFSTLRKLQQEIIKHTDNPFTELSMGMSGDFEIAIEEGSTIVRVGTGIFGPRRR